MRQRCIEQSKFQYQGLDELTKLQFGVRVKHKPYMDEDYFTVTLDFLGTEIFRHSGKKRLCSAECREFVNQGVKEWGSKIKRVKERAQVVWQAYTP